jgi:hypothetical protein
MWWAERYYQGKRVLLFNNLFGLKLIEYINVYMHKGFWIIIFVVVVANIVVAVDKLAK